MPVLPNELLEEAAESRVRVHQLAVERGVRLAQVDLALFVSNDSVGLEVDEAEVLGSQFLPLGHDAVPMHS